MPSHASIFRWRDEYEWFRVNYARAIEDRNDYWAEEIKVISHTTEPGSKTESSTYGKGKHKATTIKTVTGDMIEHRRLKIDALKWLTSKLGSRKYGDKLDINHGGQPDGVPIRTVALNTTDPVEAARAYQELMVGKKK